MKKSTIDLLSKLVFSSFSFCYIAILLSPDENPVCCWENVDALFAAKLQPFFCTHSITSNPVVFPTPLQTTVILIKIGDSWRNITQTSFLGFRCWVTVDALFVAENVRLHVAFVRGKWGRHVHNAFTNPTSLFLMGFPRTLLLCSIACLAFVW